MMDPPRLRSETGSVEALLLRSARNVEPPPHAEDEVRRRLDVVLTVGVGLAGATGIAAETARQLIGKASWVLLLKWAPSSRSDCPRPACRSNGSRVAP
jgi:hypothetical protein